MFKKLKPVLIAIIFLSSIIAILYGLVINNLELTKKNVPISALGAVVELCVLLFVLLLFYIITKRKRLALILTTLSYLIFISVTVTKIMILGTPFFPNDLFLVGDLVRTWHVFIMFVPFIIAVVLILYFVVAYEVKNTQADSFNRFISLTVALFLIFYCFKVENETIRLFLRDHNIFHKVNMSHTNRSLSVGLLSSFFQSSFFTGKPPSPENYSKTHIASLIKQYNLSGSTDVRPKDAVDNVIVLMVESFTDPIDLGWQFSEQILPNYRNMSHKQLAGTSISPVYGGKSINAEFEIMTGMTNMFTPIESTPYQEFIDAEIPSLAREFNRNGFTSNAIQMMEFSGFGYEKIYAHLGVNNKIGIPPSNPEYEKDPSGKSVSSHVVAKEMLELIREQDKSFIFAFPNSSHSPWKITDYQDKSLNLLNHDLNASTKNTLLAYTHAINHIDDMFGILIDELNHSNEKTLILIVGDHQPSLKFYNVGNKQTQDQLEDDFINLIKSSYSTPFLMWSNFKQYNTPKLNISMNLLPALISNEAGIKTRGFIKFISVLYEKFDVISRVYQLKNKPYTNQLSDEESKLIADYEMLQYDVLFGQQYLSELID
ncbi:LTA synthase family protein [Marinicella litoralis]|uniref:Phosphoglycerol transferase MdoB-like AlkP superfamily enzyme n=1 Tax=Marinicella litoralis TaxID=644220 RepID=A0A4R6XXI4_9GAMM|nr:LTA synthase family protein [Marinicella litoralis]TDR23180.1 phosphoglycerol transferase MdoB-like AlkP superfamily enzyme [Marinicella litoralis]